MELFKNILISNILGAVIVVGAVLGIVGGSLALCGASAVGLLLVGG